MVCEIELFEKPHLNNAVLIEGLPGIGFIANIATLHLIRKLKAARFAEIHCSSFQDLAVTTETGGARFPSNELYYYRNSAGGRDLIFWYGNTQALTTFGQYELCGRILDVCSELGCRLLISLGGFRQDEVREPPQLFCAGTDSATLQQVMGLGARVMVGQIYGIAGLLIGLGRIRGVKGFSLLVETLGRGPDVNGAWHALAALAKYLELDVDLSGLEAAEEETRKMLESFGLLKSVVEEKKKEEQRFRWSI
ncbi:PAC2 family protein [Candidatus Bathyarchaeota archaeon]|nr:PAC2 family protein [Candidatus Bathyarchaeota archaeon]